jgi:hypothetical protein
MLLAPVGKYANVLSFYHRASADDAGHFEFTGVTPGRYKLYAFEEMDPLAYEDPGFLKPFECSASRSTWRKARGSSGKRSSSWPGLSRRRIDGHEVYAQSASGLLAAQPRWRSFGAFRSRPRGACPLPPARAASKEPYPTP